MLKLGLFTILALVVSILLISASEIHVNVNVNNPSSNHPHNGVNHHQPRHARSNSRHTVASVPSSEVNEADSDDPTLEFKKRGGRNNNNNGNNNNDPVAQHGKWDDCWIRLNGDVMDITRFDHPLAGGIKRISAQCGKDVTQGLHGLHQAEYDIQMKNFIINPSTGSFRMNQKKNPLSFDGDAHGKLARNLAPTPPPKRVFQQKSNQDLANLFNNLA